MDNATLDGVPVTTGPTEVITPQNAADYAPLIGDALAEAIAASAQQPPSTYRVEAPGGASAPWVLRRG